MEVTGLDASKNKRLFPAYYLILSSACTLGVMCAIVWWALAPKIWRDHLFRLFSRAFVSYTSYYGTNGPGWINTEISSFISIMLIVGLIAVIRGREAMTKHLADSAVIAVSAIFVQVMVWYGPLYLRHLAAVVFADHESLARENANLRSRNAVLVDPTSRDAQITDLSREVGQLKSKKKVAVDQPLSPPKAAEPTIETLLVEIRTTCTLLDPTKLAPGVLMSLSTIPSYFEAAGSKAFLQQGPYHFKRLEEEGKVLATQTMSIPPNSELIGQPINRFLDFKKAHLIDVSVSGPYFKECSYIEVGIRINGDDVYSYAQSVSVVPEGALTIDLPLQDVKLPKKGESK